MLIRAARLLAVLCILTSILGGNTKAALAAGVVGDGTPHTCVEANLVAALAGGGLVTFHCDAPSIILMTAPRTIAQDTTIDGGGVITLTGNLATRFFVVNSGATLTLRNITLDRANSGSSDGGAISNHGGLVLENSTIQFSRTDASNSGGAIFTDGALTLTNSTLTNNQAGSGGALFANSLTAPANLYSSRFISNTTLHPTMGFGGAIWVGSAARLTVTGGQLTGNHANFGGAIYASTEAILTVTAPSPVTFMGNSAVSAGGAIYNHQANLRLAGADFIGNVSQGGGGALASFGTLKLRDSLLWHNKGSDGGGLLISLPSGGGFTFDTTIEHCLFLSNTATHEGGGLRLIGIGLTAAITDSAFVDNHANSSGGGLTRYDAGLSIARSSFTHNSAEDSGGGLFITTENDPGPNPYVTIRDTTLGANTAGSGGGALLNQDRLELINVTLKDNSSGFLNLDAFGVDGRLRGSVLQNNGPNCEGKRPSDDASNYATDTTCDFNISPQGAGLNPQLGPLESWPVGLTSFYLPLAGSPLLNQGPSNCSPLDQRGATRLGFCDIGAVELGGMLPLVWLPALLR